MKRLHCSTTDQERLDFGLFNTGVRAARFPAPNRTADQSDHPASCLCPVTVANFIVARAGPNRQQGRRKRDAEAGLSVEKSALDINVNTRGGRAESRAQRDFPPWACVCVGSCLNQSAISCSFWPGPPLLPTPHFPRCPAALRAGLANSRILIFGQPSPALTMRGNGLKRCIRERYRHFWPIGKMGQPK